MRFWNIVQDSQRYLSPYKLVLCHISTVNINTAAWKPEVHFRKSAKSHVPKPKSPDYKQQTFTSTAFIFSWAPDLNSEYAGGMVLGVNQNIFTRNVIRLTSPAQCSKSAWPHLLQFWRHSGKS